MNYHNTPTTFLAGPTGFLGHYCLRDLLRRGRRVVAMLRPPQAESARRLASLLAELGEDMNAYARSGQLVLVEGALPDSLPACTWDRTDEILNCAASLQLMADGDGEPNRTNVAGTQAIIDWAVRHGVTRIHAVSTAYTCGWNGGTIREVLHDPSPSFQTDYEDTKWQAEILLAKWAAEPGRVLTVLRPSLLIGDSESGYTTQFFGFYMLAWLVSVLREQFRNPNNGRLTHIPLRIPLRPEDRHNIVPVDFCSRMVAEILLDARMHGRIYHLTNPLPPTNSHVREWFEEYFGLAGGFWVEPGQVNGNCSEAEALIWKQVNIMLPRLMHSPGFDQSNTAEVMSMAGIEFPELTKERIFRTLDFAASRNWGRRTNGAARERENGSNGKPHIDAGMTK